MNRRTFLAASALPMVPAFGAVVQRATRRPCVISSGNGLRAITRAMEMIAGGTDPLEAAVAGVGIVESDPDDMSVGYGGASQRARCGSTRRIGDARSDAHRRRGGGP